MSSQPRLSWSGTSRAIAPPRVEPVLQRPRLEALLDDAAGRRLVTVVAEAGFGKSTLLAGWAADRSAAWLTVSAADADLGSIAAGVVESLSLRVPTIASVVGGLLATSAGPDARADESIRAGAQAALLSDALQGLLTRPVVLILDDLSELAPEAPAMRFIEALVRMAPERLHVLLSSRAEPPFTIERLRGRGQVAAIGGAELAFDPDETRRLLARILGQGGADRLAGRVHEVTAGWPAAVRLAAEALVSVADPDREAALARMVRPGGSILDYLAAEVLGQAPRDVQELLRAVAPLRRFLPATCAALGVPEPERTIAAIARRGLFLQPGSDGAWFEVHPLVREVAATALGVPASLATDTRHVAAAWFQEHGFRSDALACLTAADAVAEIAELLEADGDLILADAGPDATIEALERLPLERRGARLIQLEGAARQLRGDWDGAMACFARLIDGRGRVPAGTAWRIGLILHLRGRLDEALDAYERGDADGASPQDDAMLHAWHASALWLRGDVDRARELASRALETAERLGDDRSLAASHTVLAMLAAVDSDRRTNDAHYLRALTHATRAGDALQAIRIHANRGSHFTEEGYYTEALAELDQAVQLADLAGFAAFRALALSNRGEVLGRLGRLDEAIAELEASRRLYQRLDSRLVSYPLRHLGDVYRERGDLALARSHYEEAIRVSEADQDLQGLVPALGGLARVTVSNDPATAIDLATRAVGFGPVLGHLDALLSLGWVHLATDRQPEAHESAAAAERLARERRDRAGLAEAIELSVRSDPDLAAHRGRLDEALALWRDVGSPLGEARVQLAIAEVLEPDAARSLAEAARSRFVAIGARAGVASADELLGRLSRSTPAPVEIRTLGGFEVVRRGAAVPIAEWRSRKARDLLKLLVAARGERIPRDALLEALWPAESPERSSPRLSVALSTIRTVLDPAKRESPDHYVVATRSDMRIVAGHLPIDLLVFEADCQQGLLMAARGDVDEATALLQRAEDTYRGDFLAEDPYDDRTTSTREEARSLYARVARTLAAIAAADGRVDAAAAYLRRILERDAFDEQAHLELVRTLSAAGRHGEARRAYRTYVARMDEIGVEAAPFGDAPDDPPPV